MIKQFITTLTIFSTAGCASSVTHATEHTPVPQINGNTSTYTFTSDREISIPNNSWAYFFGGELPSFNKVRECANGTDYPCVNNPINQGQCVLKTVPIPATSGAGDLEVAVVYNGYAIKKGSLSDDFKGMSAFTTKVTYSENNEVKTTSGVLRLENLHWYDNKSLGNDVYESGFQSPSSATFLVPVIHTDSEANNIYVEICDVGLSMFQVQKISVRSILNF